MAITRIKNNQITDATITNVKILSQTLTGDLMNPNLTFNSNLTLNGNLVVTGNVTTVQSTTTQITDPLLTLGLGNSGTSYDLGLVLTRGSGGNRFIGWKENQGAFVFINTTEDGLTTGNIATTAYANVIFGNAVTLGSSTFGGITLSGNTLSAAGALTVRSDTGTVTISNATVISGATVLSSTLSVVGATTVASLTSNAGIIGTTGSFSSNLTASNLIVNNAATIGSINSSSLTVGGTATVNALVSNTTLTAASGTILGNLLVEGNLAVLGNLSYINVDSFTVKDPIIQLNTGANGAPLSADNNFDSGVSTNFYDTAPRQAFFGRKDSSGNFEYFSNVTSESGNVVTGTYGTIKTGNLELVSAATVGTTLVVGGNATSQGLTVNASAVIGTTLQAIAGIQATPIGNVSASTGAFTALTATTANIGNVIITDRTISSITTNQGLNINPNGTGVTTINSALNNSRTVINGTAANTLVVSGTQVGVNTSSFISGATFQINAVDTMLLPVGAIGDRPGSPVTGMLRYSTSQGTIEWYNGAAWAIPTGDFTVVVANTQTGNGTATIFTLPVSNASTAGTMVSINGVVQAPVSAYAITGNAVTFTEAPASTDVIDFRVFTTTSQVTEVVDIAGTTGIFFDLPAAGSQITTIKTAGTESFSIQANSTARFTGNAEPSANVTYNLGSTTNRWKDLYLSGDSIYIGDVILKAGSGNLRVRNFDDTADAGITGTFYTTSTTAGNLQIGFNHIEATNVNGNIELRPNGTGVILANSVIRLNAGIVNGQSNGVGNIGASGAGFNTIFAKATSAQYADLAENYAGDMYYEPGTVVHFGGPQEVTLCDEDMCRKVAGVVSTNPAYLMNSHLQGFATPVALQGRVPCKVRGTVRLGDMMVSAGDGFARAEANPVVGSVIGKALANFDGADGAEGIIEVVVGRL